MVHHYSSNISITTDSRAELEFSELCDLLAEVTVFERLLNDRAFYYDQYGFFKSNRRFQMKYFPHLSVDIYDALIDIFEDIKDLTGLDYRLLENDKFVEAEMAERLMNNSAEAASNERIKTLSNRSSRI